MGEFTEAQTTNIPSSRLRYGVVARVYFYAAKLLYHNRYDGSIEERVF